MVNQKLATLTARRVGDFARELDARNLDNLPLSVLLDSLRGQISRAKPKSRDANNNAQTHQNTRRKYKRDHSRLTI
jgi:hypothetical protein